MSIVNKTRLLIAVRGYKTIKNQQNVNHTDISAIDSLNNKIILRIMNPLNSRYADLTDVNNLVEQIKLDAYDSGILISSNFTERATNEMVKQNIQCISDSFMPAFALEDLYLAIISCAEKQCNKKCGKVPENIGECTEIKDADLCKTRILITNAKTHLDAEMLGFLKNDLKIALASCQITD
ncbi:MAG: hypothetical protein ACQCN3_01530 [Candidatus Bathyarchaeia archaeon]|jgi:hypothetical protein